MAEIEITRGDGAGAAAAHGAGHGAAHGAGHGAHHDVAADKQAAYIGLFGGAIVLFAFLFGMVKWTNHHLGAGEGGRPAAESTK